MGERTSIAWTDRTFNPWWGCTPVSPGCDFCYAETFDKRVHGVGNGHWGKDAPRRTFGDKHWDEPLKWSAAAEKAGVPTKVFCASMADWCDMDAPPGALERLHALWRATPWCRWQMLTKRPGRIARSLPSDWGQGYPNVWLGTTVEDRSHGVPRITVLRTIPAVVRFLSVEPLLEDPGPLPLVGGGERGDGIHWVIVGGESGHSARPFSLDWARSIKAQCERAGSAFFVKQMGEPWAVANKAMRPVLKKVAENRVETVMARDSHGAYLLNWPEDLRVQQFPEGGR